MKRQEILRLFDDDEVAKAVKDVLDGIYYEIAKIEERLSLFSINDLSAVSDAYDMIEKLANDLY